MLSKKNIVILVFGLMVLIQNTALWSQSGLLNTHLSVRYADVPLKDVLNDITLKTGIRFSYSARNIPEKAIITVPLTKGTLNEILYRVFRGQPVKFEIVDDYIILKKGIPEITDKPEEYPKNLTLSGYIKDKETSEFLIGASVYLKELKQGTGTNNYGFFSLTVPPGTYTLEITYVGYHSVLQVICLESNVKTDFSMEYRSQNLEEIVISPFQKGGLMQKLHASQLGLTPVSIEQQPALMGEPDVIKSLEFQPGIVFNSDGSSYFHVRGGNYDQNLIILDEATIFNPSHLLGLFSPIIPDAIKSVEIYKADFPVNYGGRLSSVIDINTRDGNKNNFFASGNIGLISARATLEGPLKKDESSYFISFRRSYFDEYLKPSMSSLEGLYFYDFTTKMNIKLGYKDRMFLTFYTSGDVLRNSINGDDSNGLNWGNSSFTLRWNHVFGSRLFLNSSFYSSKYDYDLFASIKSNTYWNSHIGNSSLKEELTFYQSPRITWRYGFKLSTYAFNPGNYYNPLSTNNIQVSPVNSVESSVYAGAEQDITPWLRINYGLRYTNWSNQGKAFVVDFDSAYHPTGLKFYAANQSFYKHSSVETRLSISVKTGSMSTLKASYNRTVQYLNLITNSVSPFNSLEVWLPAGPNIRPQLADITDLGFATSGSWLSLHADMYYKYLYNQIGYTTHANLLVNPSLEGELRQGIGKTYGLEISLVKENGKFTGQLSYTYSRSLLNIPGINNDRNFPAAYDKPHVFVLNMTYQQTARLCYSINYTVSSGSRFTSPTSYYSYRGYQVPVYAEENNDHLPVYHRFDISCRFRLNKLEHRFTHAIIVGLINFFNSQNPALIYFTKFKATNGQLVIPMDKLNRRELVSSMRYTTALTPSVSYQFKF